MESIYGVWHFVANDKKLGYGDNRLVEVGKTLSVDGPTALCDHGMHWSRRLLDASEYAQGHVLTYCEVWGDIKEQDDKGVSTHRKVLHMANVEELLRRFARHCATEVFYKHFKRDQYPAIDVWLKHCRAEDMAAAERAAGSAARLAAESAARSAAWQAAERAAWSAAWSAARSAAWVAAGSAARLAAESAAWSAAWSAARSAAESAARSAAKERQNQWLETEAKKLMGIER